MLAQFTSENVTQYDLTVSENEAKEETLKAFVMSSLLCFRVSGFGQEWVVFVTSLMCFLPSQRK